MLTIRDRSKVPNGLYTYTVAETSTSFKAHGFGLLVLKVREHLIANKIPVPEKLSQIVEQDWCSRRPEHCEDSELNADKAEVERGESLNNLIAGLAIPAADALSKISAALGINCPKCKKRHRIIKEMRKRGFVETVKLLKETLA